MTHCRCQSLWFFGLTSFLLGLLLGFPYDISGQSRWPVEPFEKNTRLFCKQMTCQLLVSAEIKFQLRVPYWMQVLYLLSFPCLYWHLMGCDHNKYVSVMSSVLPINSQIMDWWFSNWIHYVSPYSNNWIKINWISKFSIPAWVIYSHGFLIVRFFSYISLEKLSTETMKSNENR